MSSSLCFQILCLFLCLFTAVADPNRVFSFQLCLLEHMCTGFVIVTACKYLMSGKCLHVLDLPDGAEGGSLTPYWFRLCLLWTGCVKHSYMISADTPLKHLCADTPWVLLIVGVGRSRAILTVVLVVTKGFSCLILYFLAKDALICWRL